MTEAQRRVRNAQAELDAAQAAMENEANPFKFGDWVRAKGTFVKKFSVYLVRSVKSSNGVPMWSSSREPERGDWSRSDEYRKVTVRDI